MKVAELQSFLRSLAGPLAAAGGKSVAADLDRAAGGLQPFAELTVAQFADFLQQAEEYHRTGLLSAKPARRTGKAAVSADPRKISGAVERLRQLYERAGSDSVDYSTIEREVAAINKDLKKDELIEVAREFGIASPLKTKKIAADAIGRRITERKESVRRTQF
jgi:hypothetical protein